MSSDNNRPLVAQIIFNLHEEMLGRRRLTERVSGSESSVRTELEKLRSQGVVEMTKEGTRLTKKGRNTFKVLLSMVKDLEYLELKALAVDKETAAALLNMEQNFAQQTWYYRDLAIREGATGAVMIKVNSELRFIDGSEMVGVQNPNDDRILKKAFPDWKDGRFIVLVSASDKGDAQRGLWRIILESCREINGQQDCFSL